MKNYISGKILLGLESFPGLPKNGAELLAIIEKPRTTVTQNFFELVNSLFFAMPSKIISVKQATVLLGVKRLKQNVLVTCSSSVMDQAVPDCCLKPKDLWQHSIKASITAVELAKYKKLSESEDIFTSALLRDIGTLALGMFVKENTSTIKKIVSKGVPFEVAENMVL